MKRKYVQQALSLYLSLSLTLLSLSLLSLSLSLSLSLLPTHATRTLSHIHTHARMRARAHTHIPPLALIVSLLIFFSLLFSYSLSLILTLFPSLSRILSDCPAHYVSRFLSWFSLCPSLFLHHTSSIKQCYPSPFSPFLSQSYPKARIHKGGLSTNLGLCASFDAFRRILTNLGL